MVQSATPLRWRAKLLARESRVFNTALLPLSSASGPLPGVDPCGIFWVLKAFRREGQKREGLLWVMVSASQPRTFRLVLLTKCEVSPQIPVVVVGLENQVQPVVRSEIADQVNELDQALVR